MKEWLKGFLFRKYRIKRRPSNQLMMMWVKKELAENHKLRSAIDVGCGKAINRRYFKNERYTGVDFKEEFLSKARVQYPDDTFKVCNLVTERPPRGDLVVCTLVLNNKHYPREKTLDGVSNLVSCINSRGTLIFTTGETNFEYESNIDSYLESYFEFVAKKRYGRFNRPTYLSFLIAWTMFYSSSMRKNPKNRMTLYICHRKKID